MSLYKNWFITEMLRDALQGGANSTSKVVFKRMVASEDMVSDKDFPGLTNSSMQTIKTNQTTLISSTKTKDNIVTITSVFNSFKVVSEYKMNTIYLIAEYNGREFLAAITSANDPYTMPAESKNEHAEYTFKLQIGISNTEQVDLNMDPEAVATNEQLIAVKDKLDSVDADHGNRIEKLEVLEEKNVKLVDSQQIYGIKTFVERIIGTITKALNAEKLETPRKINGVPFDGTKDINIPVDSDTGWKPITLTKDFEPYDGDKRNIPVYKIRNGVVTIKGVLKVTKTIQKSNNGTIIGTLPKEAVGSGLGVSSIQQGSGGARWSLDVQANGQLNFRRYADSTGLADVTPENWLPFSTTYAL